MTDAEMVTAAKQRLSDISMRALQVHLTKRTREFILETHTSWQNALVAYQINNQPMPLHTVEAFSELQEMTTELLQRNGFDPDVYLHWIDLYPSLVVNIYLREPMS